jgi:hypothetical protein
MKFCVNLEERKGLELLREELVNLLRQRAEKERDEAVRSGERMRRVHVYAAQRLTALADELISAQIKTDWDEVMLQRK